MKAYTRLAARLYGVPLLVLHSKAAIIEGVLRRHLADTKLLEVPREGEVERMPPPPASASYAGINFSESSRTRPYLVTQAGVAIIPIIGTLVQRGSWLDAPSGLQAYDTTAALIVKAAADEEVRALLLEIDSAGGEASGITDLAALVRETNAKKPTWAAVNEQAYSAAYWIASAAGSVYVPKTGGVGSIGVVMLHVDQSARDQQDGYAYTFIYSGARKVDGNPHQALSKEALDWAQSEVDRLYELFVAAVAGNRLLAPEAVRATEAGSLTPDEALQGGFIDGVQSLLETVRMLEQKLGPRSSPAPGARPAGGGVAGSGNAERTRLATVLRSEAAASRGDLAMHLALDTNVAAQLALTILESAPRGSGLEFGSGRGFAEAMAALGNPRVGVDLVEGVAERSVSSPAEIYAFRNMCVERARNGLPLAREALVAEFNSIAAPAPAVDPRGELAASASRQGTTAAPADIITDPERRRAAGILRSDAARGRAALALKLVLDTDLDEGAAIALLSRSGRARA